MWRCFWGRSGESDAESDDQCERVTQDSVYRYYFDAFEAQQTALEQQLHALQDFDAASYAQACSREVSSGRRAQEILSQMKTLKKELHLCQFHTHRPSPAFDPVTPRRETPPTGASAHSEECDARPLPEWITREMENRRPLSHQAQAYVNLQASSNVLTLAGRVLSAPSAEPSANYYQIFNLHRSDPSSREGQREDG